MFNSPTFYLFLYNTRIVNELYHSTSSEIPGKLPDPSFSGQRHRQTDCVIAGRTG